MKNKILVLVMISALTNYAQKEALINGNWSGSLQTPGGALALTLKISQQNGVFSTKMDVPAQGAKDLRSNKTEFRNDTLTVEFAILRASYKGILKSDSAFIKGIWKQGGAELPLKLLKDNARTTTVMHPQEPQKPYPYNEEEVTVENSTAKIKLAGTFTWPKDKANCPVVVLITGSGPQNRDEELLGQKPFLVLTDRLVKSGIAVLRCDDRGTGASTGDFKTATTFDFATDVEAAIHYVKTRKEINKKKIGLIGHSEGGLIAPIVASRSKDVSFIVLLAGTGLKGIDVIALQSAAIAKASGISEENAAKAMTTNRKLYAFALAGSRDSIVTELKRQGAPEATANAQAAVLLSAWYRTFLATDPAVYLEKVNCPVLALNGKKDVQVVYKENLEAIDKSLSKNKQHTIRAYDNLNHLFQHCTTGGVEEYGQIEETMSEEVMKDISDWIAQLK